MDVAERDPWVATVHVGEESVIYLAGTTDDDDSATVTKGAEEDEHDWYIVLPVPVVEDLATRHEPMFIATLLGRLARDLITSE